jgi:ribonucleoside-triphosphate reductase
MSEPSVRSKIVTRRTYNRPKDNSGKSFESWEETVDRVIGHQAWLWDRAAGVTEGGGAWTELEELRQLMLDRKVLTSGRTLWLGGTDVAKKREASQFNCSFTHVETVYDVVDVLWLLLQGCGVGFRPIIGQLTGFVTPVKSIKVINSTRTSKGGRETNLETWDASTKTWTISVGDSAEAWAKSIGKLLAGKYPAETLVLDFSEIRPAGERLAGYGWISSGDKDVANAYLAIANILNRRAGSLLSRIDILDVVNWLGTVLSSRRSAEIALFPYGEDEWEEFSVAKKEYWKDNPQRGQSNNSLLFWNKPTKDELTNIFNLMIESGGSEPGFINGAAARKRAPWFKGVNPCAEILLGNKAFCNLVEVDIGKFKGDSAGLQRAIELASRACYRQTCVELRDGILQEAWHLNNAFLRLCGVGLTGIVQRPDLSAYDYQGLQRSATHAAYQMAEELGTPKPKNVTTVKPSGTVSKVMDTTEGVHKPLGKYIFNNINFSKHDPIVDALRLSGYRCFDNPMDANSVLVTFPVEWSSVEFDKVGEVEVNNESAITQLERYKMLMQNWCQQNVSCTVSYSADEAPSIVKWLLDNWDNYVGVSFLFRTDPTKTAKDLGYLYLPQEVVSKETFDNYVATLQPVEIDQNNTLEEISDSECSSGACPIR